MTPEDRLIQINNGFELLAKYVAFVKRKGRVTANELISNDDLRAVIERNLQLACEVVLDIASQLIAEFRFRTPEKYQDSILILGESGVLEMKFAKSFADIAGFRNILVHEYRKINYEKVADLVNNHLGDFERFAKDVSRYLSS